MPKRLPCRSAKGNPERNCLLRALPDRAYRRFTAALEEVSLVAGQVL